MRIEIKEMKLQNFKGIKDLTVNFGNRTSVFGQNASGKTSIVDAFMWVLFNKDSSGVEKFELRPLDALGQKIDYVEIMVSVTLLINGIETVLQKVQKQNWVKKQGTDTTKFQGNVNDFQWNGEPIAEKIFKDKIAEIVDETKFKLLTDPRVFPNKPWKEQREMLLKLVSGVTDEMVQLTDPKFSGLDLEKKDETGRVVSGHGIDGLIAICKKAILEFKDKQKEIPSRIDEVSKQLSTVDASALELQKNDLIEQIKAIEAKEEDGSKARDEYSKINRAIMEIQFKKSDIEKAENAGLIEKRKAAYDKKSSASINFDTAQTNVSKLESRKTAVIAEISRKSLERENLLADYNAMKDRQFDESSLICSYCGAEFSEEKKESMREMFETGRKSDIDRNIESGKAITAEIKSFTEEIQKIELQIQMTKEQKVLFNKEQNEAIAELEKLPMSVDLTGNIEYQSLITETAEPEKQLSEMNSGADYTSVLKTQKQGIQEQLKIVEQQLLAFANNSKVEDRIEELKTEMKDIGQKVASQEKQLFLLEEFTRAKCNLLSGKLNSMFHLVNFKLFDMQINGLSPETCEVTVNGVPYKDLNSGHKIIAGLDIIRTLSEINNVEAPIFIDNAESINGFNIPEIDTQMVLLKVSDDKELVVQS